MRIRVLIADDHAIFRRGLRSLLADDPDITVVGEADSGASTLSLVERLAPDVVTLDIRMGGMDGIQTTRMLVRHHANIRVIVLSTYEEQPYLLGALQAGAYAYLLKSTSYDTLATAIRTVYAGQRLLAPDLISHVLEDYQRLAQEQIRRDSGLAPQEIEVLRMLADGVSTQEVAERLFWSEITVKRKVQDIVDKLQVTNRVQAVAEAIRRGLI
jgi:two-component system response regulator DevR